MMAEALKWLQKNLLGVLVAHLIILGVTYLGIWQAAEPLGIPDRIESFPDFAKTRIFIHLVLTVLIAAYLTIFLLVVPTKRKREIQLGPNMYGVKIHHPGSGDDVGASFEISGTYEIKPPQDSIRIMEFSPISQEYWPKKYILYNDKEKKWYSTVHIGASPGEKREIVVAHIGEDGKALLKYFDKVKDKTEKWVGIEVLPPSITECDRLVIKRGGTV